MTPEQVLSAATKFDKKSVEIVGFLVCEREHCAIYSVSGSRERAQGIWLGNSGISEKIMKAYNRKEVRVVGVFHNRQRAGTGHFNLWPSEMRKCTTLDEVKDSVDDIGRQ